MRLRLSKLREYVASSNGEYTLDEKEGEYVLSFNSRLDSVSEHYTGATIRVYASSDAGFVDIVRAEMDYGGSDVKAISVESLYPWLLSIDEETEL